MHIGRGKRHKAKNNTQNKQYFFFFCFNLKFKINQKMAKRQNGKMAKMQRGTNATENKNVRTKINLPRDE